MKNIKIAFILFTLCFVAPVVVLAGAGHDHGHSHAAISATEAQIKASEKMRKMAKAGKIDGTWSAIKTGTVSQKDFGHGPEWVITFKNSKVKDASKQTLYMFYSQDGHYIAANYDGS